MHRFGIFLKTLLLLVICLSPYGIFAQDKAVEQKAFGAEAIWRPTDTVIRNMGKACEQGGDCFITRMIEAGAHPAAVEFTQIIIDNGFPFCFMKSFQEMGQVDLVMIDCPFMANTMGFTLLVNGNPAIFHPGDRKYLNTINLTENPNYSDIIQKYPHADMWIDGNLDRMIQLADGGQRFIWKHKLMNGCRACEVAGMGTIAYDFDKNGHFKGLKLLQLSDHVP